MQTKALTVHKIKQKDYKSSDAFRIQFICMKRLLKFDLFSKLSIPAV